MKHLKNFDQLQESIFESSYSDFLTSRGKELKNSVKMLKNIFSSTKEIPENFHDNIDGVLQKYDDNLDRLIFSHNENITVDDIAKFAIDNMNRYGTEPQMVLFAIEEVYNLLSKELRLDRVSLQEDLAGAKERMAAKRQDQEGRPLDADYFIRGLETHAEDVREDDVELGVELRQVARSAKAQYPNVGDIGLSDIYNIVDDQEIGDEETIQRVKDEIKMLWTSI